MEGEIYHYLFSWSAGRPVPSHIRSHITTDNYVLQRASETGRTVRAITVFLIDSRLPFTDMEVAIALSYCCTTRFQNENNSR